MKQTRTLAALAAVAIGFNLPLSACFWDSDTLNMEMRWFPQAYELITGNFVRHSPEVYEWRVADRTKQIAADSTKPALYDDLAVAYEKLGNHEKAIETILEKDRKFPGLYETYANLGTFYIHAGQLERGLEQIDRAIAINPDAHFGREIYQKRLVEYVLSKQVNGKTPLPLHLDNDDLQGNNDDQQQTHFGFKAYLLERLPDETTSDDAVAEIAAATKGVLGMMHFGDHDSPVLLEALGDLLRGAGVWFGHIDSNQLAVFAYLRASYSVNDETAKSAYRKLARGVHNYFRVDEGELRTMLDEGVRQSELIRSTEKQWIAEGKNPDEEFLNFDFGAMQHSAREQAGLSINSNSGQFPPAPPSEDVVSTRRSLFDVLPWTPIIVFSSVISWLSYQLWSLKRRRA